MKIGNWARNLRQEFNKTVILFILCIVIDLPIIVKLL